MSIEKMKSELRGSSCAGKKASVANVGLEDFDIQMQLGQGTFGRVYLAQLPQTG